MKELEKYLNINDFLIVSSKLLGLRRLDNEYECLIECKSGLELISKVVNVCPFSTGLIYYDKIGGSDLFYTDFSQTTKIFDGKCIVGMNSNNGSFIKFQVREIEQGVMIESRWILRNDGNIEKSKIGFHFFLADHYLLKINKNELLSYSDVDGTIAWQSDLSRIGPYIKMDGTAAETNQIDGELMVSEDYRLIYVPMAGRQLVALNASDGKVRWVQVYKTRKNGVNYHGLYSFYNEKLYRHDGATLSKIDALTGDVEKTVHFEDIHQISDLRYNFGNDDMIKPFSTSSPIVIQENRLIVWEVREGYVVVFDTETLDYVCHVHIENVPGIAHSKTVVAWQNNKLYVLDMNRTLHVFEPSAVVRVPTNRIWISSILSERSMVRGGTNHGG